MLAKNRNQRPSLTSNANLAFENLNEPDVVVAEALDGDAPDTAAPEFSPPLVLPLSPPPLLPTGDWASVRVERRAVRRKKLRICILKSMVRGSKNRD